MENKPLKVLLIEDSLTQGKVLIKKLSQADPGVSLRWERTLTFGLNALDDEKPDAVLLDLTLPDGEGADTFMRTFYQAPDVPIVVLSGVEDEGLALDVIREGAQDYVFKGSIDGRQILRSIRGAIERKRIENSLSQAAESLRQREEEMKSLIVSLQARLARGENEDGLPAL
jgi:DNA-binding response OmpR family regulator